MQLLLGDESEATGLRLRTQNFIGTDDDIAAQRSQQNYHSEQSFREVSDLVEKNEIDMYGTLLDHQKTCLDFYFVGSLQNFNLPLIQTTWNDDQTNLLDLPTPCT